MASKKPESFKIGDKQKPMVSSVAKRAPADDAQDEAAPQSVGFKRIEGILDQHDQSEVQRKFTGILAALREFEKKATANKEKAAVKKAIVAVERARELMDFLYQTKSSMLQGAGK